MIYSIAVHFKTTDNNAFVKFNNDFNFVYEKAGVVVNVEFRTGRLKRILQFADGIKVAFALRNLKRGDHVILRYPFNKVITKVVLVLTKITKAKSVVVIEDLNCIRFGSSQRNEKSIETVMQQLNAYDIIMSPNAGYIDFLKQYIQREYINFEIYPYCLPENIEIEETPTKPTNKICFAGNMVKASFLFELSPEMYTLDLFGSIRDDRRTELEQLGAYHGLLGQEALIKQINQASFGLVWDGTALDMEHDRSGLGQYLKWNTPNKLCLYLAVGIPVIVWSKSAMAEFVRKNEVGLILDDLFHLNDEIAALSPETYYHLQKNAKNISHKIQNGEHLLNAISAMASNL